MRAPSFAPAFTPYGARSTPSQEERRETAIARSLMRLCTSNTVGSSGAGFSRGPMPGSLFDTRDSWHNCNRAKLVEVVIERKSLLKMQLVDHNLTGTVCKTPLFIGNW